MGVRFYVDAVTGGDQIDCEQICSRINQQLIAGSSAAQRQGVVGDCAICNWLLHPAPTSTQDGHDPLQLALVVFFMSSIHAKTSLALLGVITCNLHWWCFSYAN